MMEESKNPQPGDHLLNKYFPDADNETRERAREAFRKYALILLRLGTKIEQEMLREQGNDSQNRDNGVILPPVV